MALKNLTWYKGIHVWLMLKFFRILDGDPTKSTNTFSFPYLGTISKNYFPAKKKNISLWKMSYQNYVFVWSTGANKKILILFYNKPWFQLGLWVQIGSDPAREQLGSSRRWTWTGSSDPEGPKKKVKERRRKRFAHGPNFRVQFLDTQWTAWPSGRAHRNLLITK